MSAREPQTLTPPALRSKKNAQIAACMVSSTMDPGPRNVRMKAAGQHCVSLWQDVGQREQAAENRPPSISQQLKIHLGERTDIRGRPTYRGRGDGAESDTKRTRLPERLVHY